jgi:hypothetical protein
MTKMRLRILGIGLASLAMTATVQANEGSTDMKVDLIASNTNVANGNKDVTIGYSTREEMSGVCDLTLYSFLYDEQSKSVSLNAKSEEPCLNESYGKRTGATVWRVPASVINKSEILTLFINSEKAGQLVVKDGQALLVPENSTF